VGALASTEEFDRPGFLTGVRQGYATQTLISDLFSLRSGVLLQHHSSDSLHSRLSGLLIGSEIREALHLIAPNSKDSVSKVGLIGSDALCVLYENAFECLGITAVWAGDTAAVDGFQEVARRSTIK